jgi:hypothetical protein
LPISLQENFYLTFLDDKHAVSWFTFLENNLSGLEKFSQSICFHDDLPVKREELKYQTNRLKNAGWKNRIVVTVYIHNPSPY